MSLQKNFPLPLIAALELHKAVNAESENLINNIYSNF